MAASALKSYAQYERKITELITEFGEISLKSLKDEYKKVYSVDLPFSEDEVLFADWLMSLNNVNFSVKNSEKLFWMVNQDVLKTPKRKISSPLQGRAQTPSKRSRSAPGKDNEEDEEEKKPSTRPSRVVRFQNEKPKENEGRPQRNNRGGGTNRDPRMYNGNNKQQRGKPRSKSENRHENKNRGIPHMYGSVLIGDDFLMGIAMFNLNFHTEKDVNGLLQSGLCVSGLTIAAAVQRILKRTDSSECKTALIYLGSLDIINGRELVQMMCDFNLLMEACCTMNLKPILCTLAPIQTHQLNNRKETLKGFNQFLTMNSWGLPVIDINKAFTNDGKSLDQCYMVVPRPISGNRSELALWSPEGRKRFYSMILKNLGFALNCKETTILDYM